MSMTPATDSPQLDTDGEYEVIIVGAGAAGIGMGIVLRDLGIECFAILERHAIGASFERWPREMRFITPSFPGNAFGQLDLNAIALNTSPAYTLQREHPTGAEYAAYLRVIAQHFSLPIHAGIDVHALEPRENGSGFVLHTSAGQLRGKYVIWAAGEFQYPRTYPFPGAEWCRHNAEVAAWAEIAGDEIVVIGGFESGIDAAYHLALAGKRVRVLDDAASWEEGGSDPSVALTPYTRERLDLVLATGRVELIGGARVVEVTSEAAGYLIRDLDGDEWRTPNPPILATGFTGSLSLVRDLFDWTEQGQVIVSEDDQSTRVPGLFVVGPSLRHDNAIFCYIYKFRQRFAVVGRAIGTRLGIDLAPLEAYAGANMLLDDLSCCGKTCAC